MTALAVAGVSIGRLLRDRTAMFFAVLLPLVVILIIGATVSSFESFRVGVVDPGSGPLGQRLVASLSDSAALEVIRYLDTGSPRPGLRRGEVAAVVVLPASYDADLNDGQEVVVTVLADTAKADNRAALSAIDAVVGDQAALAQAASFAAERGGGTPAEQLPQVIALAETLPQVEVEVETVDADSNVLPGGFSYRAPTVMILFVFINALAGGAAMIQTRRLGIYSRAMAAPVRAGSIVLGEALTYFALALLQSTIIVVAGALVFGVDWGHPLGAGLLVVVWALVGAGAGMLSGTVFRTPEQASSIGPAVGIALGMIGGTMWPLEIVGPFMQQVGHIAPHAWAVDAWTVLLSRGGGVADVATQLAILTTFATVLLVLASLRLRRRLTA